MADDRTNATQVATHMLDSGRYINQANMQGLNPLTIMELGIRGLAKSIVRTNTNAVRWLAYGIAQALTDLDDKPGADEPRNLTVLVLWTDERLLSDDAAAIAEAYGGRVQARVERSLTW